MPDDPDLKVVPGWLGWRPRWGGPLTDPIGMEFALEENADTRAQLRQVRLETAAAVYRAIADGTERASKISGPGGD